MKKKEEVKPQYIPLRCPVCQGHTTVNWGKEICKACKGKGWLPIPPKEENNGNK
jgi:DnaJ-class molecular chaperone